MSIMVAARREDISVAVLITCYNRREQTLRCLRCLHNATQTPSVLDIFLVDDRSTDGTAEAVLKAYPHVTVINGTGNLYWNGGMKLAWEVALSQNPTFYLWLNDDVELKPNIIDTMIDEYRLMSSANDGRVIIVGKLVNSRGATVYGGLVSGKSYSRIAFRQLNADEKHCQSFNGNCVLIPGQAVREIGMISDKYVHAFGDSDYGLRAWKGGYKLIQLTEPVGDSEGNPQYAKSISKLTIYNAKYVFTHPKGIPFREWLYFCRSHAGRFWILNFIWRYVKIIRIY